MTRAQTRHLSRYDRGTIRERSLALLMRLNEARSIGQRDAADELALELEVHDMRIGYRRSAAHAKAFAAVVKGPRKEGSHG